MTAFNSLLTLLFRVHVLGLPQIPEDPLDDLTDWFSESSSVFNVLKDALQSFYLNRIERLNSMQRKSKDLLWWPFTQHNLVPQDSVTVIDSRCGENFSAYKVSSLLFIYFFFKKIIVMKLWLHSKVG
jgi:dethiobiotin synthetase/adenosylmethionine--8-amino-7-oxononanoate aminotransferase